MAIKSVQRYIEIKQRIGELERELDELKDEVFQAVDKKGGEVAEENFVVRCYKQPKYKFSESYDKRNSELKELRKSEIENGIAQIEGYSEFVRVRFTTQSDDND